MDKSKIDALVIVVAGTLVLFGAAIGAYQSREDDPFCGAFFGAVFAPLTAFAALMILAILAIYFRSLWILFQ